MFYNYIVQYNIKPLNKLKKSGITKVKFDTLFVKQNKWFIKLNKLQVNFLTFCVSRNNVKK